MKLNFFLIVTSFILLVSCNSRSGYVSIVDLKCEYLVNPIGLDSENPRLSWQMKSEQQGTAQTAYMIFAGTDSVAVSNGEGNTWQSGKIKSSKIPVVYQGPALQPFTRYYWGVKVKNENASWSDISPIAFFETGMMEQENWKGSWITDGQENSKESYINDPPDQYLKKAPYFRKSLKLDKKISSARAYIAVAGLYELFINGERIGDHRLDPMFTRFDRRTLYVTYDVTGHLKNGENVIGVLLGNGWYNHQSKAVWYFDRAPWRARPRFCMDLRMVAEDSSEELIRTGQDQGWKTALGPIIFNSIYTGEHYDARLQLPGWNNIGFDDSKWMRTKEISAPSANITAQSLHPIRDIEEIPATDLVKLDNRTYVFNFGRNFSGVTRLKVSGAPGTIIRLKHAEWIDEQGRPNVSNIDVHQRPVDDSDPFQTDIFILSGEGEESFMPMFNYKGFQYVEVLADKPVTLTKESLTAYFMHSDVPAIGKIHSSNPLINKLWEAANASYLSNLFGYPTDCPTREKNGWNGDSHLVSEMGLYNFDAITIYEKWMADFRDEQKPNGMLPAIVPTAGWGYNWANGPDWTSTIALIPWDIYMFYGDISLLEKCYDSIKRYVNLIDYVTPSGLTDWALGDWHPVVSRAPREFMSSAYFYVDAVILSKTAKLLGKTEDHEKYSALAEKIKEAINKKYLNKETAIYGSGFQTELSFALHWHLVPDELVEKVAENLANRVIADGSHVDVGQLGSKTLLNALSENGYADLAYKVASQETYPSWGWWIVNGATTFLEHWKIGVASLNHINYGEISAWFYKALGGIFPDESQPGFKNVILRPNFVAGLDHFEASFNGPYGNIISSWEKSGDQVLYNLTIPPNSTASLYLKSRDVSENSQDISENKYITVDNNEKQFLALHLKSGKYKFSITETKSLNHQITKSPNHQSAHR